MDEYETTYEKQDDGYIHMHKGVLRLSPKQAEALGSYGTAWMYDDAAWSQNGIHGSLYQNVNLPEGPVQIELKLDGTLVKHPIGKHYALAKRILNALPLPANCEGDVLQRINLIESTLMEVLG